MSKTDIKIHQIYFEERHKQFLSPLFTPYFNNDHHGFYEFGVFLREFTKNTHLSQTYTGFVSWKFESKSFVPSSDFLKLQQNEPNKDVYFLNPFPELVPAFKNVWVQGAESHPGLLMLAQKIFDHLGLKTSLLDMVNDDSNTLYCNYWFANQKFWTEYMNFCQPFYDLLSRQETQFFREIRQSAGYHGGGTFIPFFMERLFSTFLVLRPDISKANYPWTPEQRNKSLSKMRHQLNLYEAKLDELRKIEEARPYWKKWFL